MQKQSCLECEPENRDRSLFPWLCPLAQQFMQPFLSSQARGSLGCPCSAVSHWWPRSTALPNPTLRGRHHHDASPSVPLRPVRGPPLQAPGFPPGAPSAPWMLRPSTGLMSVSSAPSMLVTGQPRVRAAGPVPCQSIGVAQCLRTWCSRLWWAGWAVAAACAQGGARKVERMPSPCLLSCRTRAG